MIVPPDISNSRPPTSTCVLSCTRVVRQNGGGQGREANALLGSRSEQLSFTVGNMIRRSLHRQHKYRIKCHKSLAERTWKALLRASSLAADCRRDNDCNEYDTIRDNFEVRLPGCFRGNTNTSVSGDFASCTSLRIVGHRPHTECSLSEVIVQDARCVLIRHVDLAWDSRTLPGNAQNPTTLFAVPRDKHRPDAEAKCIVS